MTTEHKAPDGWPGSGPGGVPGQGAAAAPLVAAESPTDVRSGRGRLFGIGVVQLVVCELAALAIVLHRSVLVLVLGPVALLVVVVTLGRRNGRWLYEDWAVRRDFRRRATARQAAATMGGPVQYEDPRLAALHELHPGLQVTEVVDRSGVRIGVVEDGRCCSAMLAVEPFGVASGSSAGTGEPQDSGLLLDIVADALSTRDVALAGIQVVTHTVPAPTAGLPDNAPCVRSYGSLSAGVVPARRSTWIVPRLDPIAAPAAVAARGGGAVGAHRALLGTLSRLSASLRFAGIDARPVGAQEALAVLSLTAGATARAVTIGAPRTTELWDSCAVDDTVQTCFWVRSWPGSVRPGDRGLLARLGDVRGRFTVVSLAMTGEDPRGVHVRAVVRVAAGSREELEYLGGEVHQAAQGARLIRLDGQQVPGVLDTMPLGGSGT
jgi:type VII secretion protein EccE